MKNLWAGILGLSLLTLAAVAQTGTRPDIGAGQGLKLAPGTKVKAKLMRPLNAAKSRQGDLVKAEVLEDVEVNGKVLIPRKAQLFGHVSEAQPRSKAHPDGARLGFVFDSVKFAEQKVALQAVLESLEPYTWNPHPDSGYGDPCEYTIGFCAARDQPVGRDWQIYPSGDKLGPSSNLPTRPSESDPRRANSGFDKFSVQSAGCQEPVIVSRKNIKLGWYTQLFLATPSVDGGLAVLPLRLSGKIDSRGATPGDEIAAIVTGDTLLNGQLSVAKDTRLVGRVVKTVAWKEKVPLSYLEIAFDKAISPDGKETAFAALIPAAWPDIRTDGVRFRWSVGNDDVAIPNWSKAFLQLYYAAPPEEINAMPELSIGAHGRDVVLDNETRMALYVCRAAGN
jgi:hypothetical protein